MDELFQQLILHIRSGWRFRWQALTLSWILALAGWSLLSIGAAGAVAIPFSAFWLGIVLSIPLLMHVYRHGPRND